MVKWCISIAGAGIFSMAPHWHFARSAGKMGACLEIMIRMYQSSHEISLPSDQVQVNISHEPQALFEVKRTAASALHSLLTTFPAWCLKQSEDHSCAMGFCCSVRCYNAPHAYELPGGTFRRLVL